MYQQQQLELQIIIGWNSINRYDVVSARPLIL